jgi:acetyl-CoA carboxylase carboxyl transferase subunit beta
MGLFSRKKSKIKITSTKRDGFSGWLKCTHCNELIHGNELERNLSTCPKCDYHYRLSVGERIELLCDVGSFSELFGNITSVDTLQFVDTESYKKRLEKAKEKSGSSDAVITGVCTIRSIPCALGVFDFNFMGGSMGSVVGEKLTRLIEYATEHHLPLIIVSTSGGARMQESTLSLMQMAKTSAALGKMHEERLPYISILTNPTTGGVTASFASLGDIILAEPNALICFAGPRVIEQFFGKALPEGAQQAEFLLKHGMIDLIVKRHKMKEMVADILEFATANKQNEASSQLSISQLDNLIKKQNMQKTSV